MSNRKLLLLLALSGSVPVLSMSALAKHKGGYNGHAPPDTDWINAISIEVNLIQVQLKPVR